VGLRKQTWRLSGVALLIGAVALTPVGLASSASRLGGALCFSPQAGIGLVARLPWWDLRFAGVVSGDSSGGAMQVTRNWPVRRWLFLPHDLEPLALETFAGIRFSSPGSVDLVGGVGKRFYLFPDLHLDLDLGLALGQSAGGFVGLRAVQDL
jgi:hypothetical protein